jgi:hypothetical protein
VADEKPLPTHRAKQISLCGATAFEAKAKQRQHQKRATHNLPFRGASWLNVGLERHPGRRRGMVICDRLRALREEKKLSQGDIEKRTGPLRLLAQITSLQSVGPKK